MSGSDNICVKCNRTYPSTVKFCVMCGNPLAPLQAPRVEVERQVEVPEKRMFDAAKALSGMKLVKAKKGEAEVPSWEAFKEVVAGVESFEAAVKDIRRKVEDGFAAFARMMDEVKGSVAELSRVQNESFQKVNEGVALLSTTINNQMNDLLASISSVGRFVRDLDPAMSTRFEDIRKQILALAEDVSRIREELASVEGRGGERVRNEAH